MRSPQQLSLPGLAVLVVVALVLMYFEKGDGGRDVPSGPSVSTTSGKTTSGGGGTEGSGARNADYDGGDPPEAMAAAARSGGEPGDFDYYSLVLSWSPTHCESPEGRDDDTQCAPRGGRRYSFILHGLWPQYERGYPEDCPTRTRPYVSQSVIDQMFDIMPSKRLIIYEYRKHGTCSGLTPEGYYQTARRMFQSITIPQQFRNPPSDQFMSPGEVVRAFVAANPALKPDMFGVACRGPGTRFRELRICFSKTGAPRACGPNEEQRKLCRGDRMHVPPVR